MRRLLLLLTVVALLTTRGDALRAQTPSVFQAGVDLVQLDVVVLDRNRRPVTGLTAADFTITEDGESRDVQAFAAITLPGPGPATAGAPWTREVAPDIVSNALPDEGRLVVIMLDHSIPVGAMTMTAQAIARAAVDALGPNDLAAVVRSSPFTGEGDWQNFTPDGRLLREAIDSPFIGLTKEPPTITFDSQLEDHVPELRESINCPCGICQWYAIERIANELAPTRNRHKSLLFIGRDILVNPGPGDPRVACDTVVSEARDNTLRALDRANVTVHSIDPSGLETLADSASGMRRLPPLQNLERHARLGVLPDYTGGRTILNTNAPESFMPQLFDESSSYYLLGFSRGERAPDTRDLRRTIRVRVNRPNVTVRSRTGYYVSAPVNDADATSDPDMTALDGLLPRGDLPLRLGLTPRFRPDGTPEVVVLVDLNEAVRPTLEAAGESTPAPGTAAEDKVFEVAIGILDSTAHHLGTERQTVQVPAAMATSGRHIGSSSQITLDPGRYEIRVAATDVKERTTGSVYGYVEVPEADDVSLSGILIGTPTNVGTGVVARAAAPAALAPSPRRQFSTGDGIAANVQVLARGSRAPVILRSSIRDDQDRVVFESSTTLDPSRFVDAPVSDVTIPLPLASLSPGRYLLTMETGEGEDRLARQVRFEVEEANPAMDDSFSSRPGVLPASTAPTNR